MSAALRPQTRAPARGVPRGRGARREASDPLVGLVEVARLVGGEDAELQGYRLEPIASWHIRMQPFPFGKRSAAFSLVRRVIPKDGKRDILGQAPERVDIVVEP